MRKWIKEVLLVMGQSLRMLFFERKTIVLFVCGMLILAAMLLSMDEVKEEKSRISIGIADADDSDFSREVIKEMQQMELYEVVTGGEEELLELLRGGELSAVCVLRNRLEERVQKGKSDNLVTIYETEDSSALLVGDVLAGVMMQEICTAKGYQTLLDYQKKTGREATLTSEEYRSYVAEVLAQEETGFSFETTYLSQENKKVEKPSQAVIYEQAIFAVFALMEGLVAMYAVLPFRKLRHGTLAERMRTLPLQESTLYTGSALGAFLVAIAFSVMFLACFSVRNEIETEQIILLLICTAAYICVIVCIMLIAAYGIQSQTVYQMGMLAMILMFGVCGLVSLADGLLLPEGTVTWVPNGWYVRKMTELLNNG